MGANRLISILEVEAIVKSLSFEVESTEGYEYIEILYKFIEQEKERRNKALKTKQNE